jgi:hypothetical protein
LLNAMEHLVRLEIITKARSETGRIGEKGGLSCKIPALWDYPAELLLFEGGEVRCVAPIGYMRIAALAHGAFGGRDGEWHGAVDTLTGGENARSREHIFRRKRALKEGGYIPAGPRKEVMTLLRPPPSRGAARLGTKSGEKGGKKGKIIVTRGGFEPPPVS